MSAPTCPDCLRPKGRGKGRCGDRGGATCQQVELRRLRAQLAQARASERAAGERLAIFDGTHPEFRVRRTDDADFDEDPTWRVESADGYLHAGDGGYEWGYEQWTNFEDAAAAIAALAAARAKEGER